MYSCVTTLYTPYITCSYIDMCTASYIDSDNVPMYSDTVTCRYINHHVLTL